MKEKLALLAMIAVGAASGPSWAQEVRAPAICPPRDWIGQNLAFNPSFEKGAPLGQWKNCPAPTCTVEQDSAAAGWIVHTHQLPGSTPAHPLGSGIRTRLVLTNVPPGTEPSQGQRMLQVVADTGETGVYQRFGHAQLSSLKAPKKLMISAWVFVKRGQVYVSANAGPDGPGAYSYRLQLNQWVQLRGCTDSARPDTYVLIWNQAPNGAEFFIDRVEVREWN